MVGVKASQGIGALEEWRLEMEFKRKEPCRRWKMEKKRRKKEARSGFYIIPKTRGLSAVGDEGSAALCKTLGFTLETCASLKCITKRRASLKPCRGWHVATKSIATPNATCVPKPEEWSTRLLGNFFPIFWENSRKKIWNSKFQNYGIQSQKILSRGKSRSLDTNPLQTWNFHSHSDKEIGG